MIYLLNTLYNRFGGLSNVTSVVIFVLLVLHVDLLNWIKHHPQVFSIVTNNKSLFCIQDAHFLHLYETKKVSTQDMSSRYDVHENLHTFPSFPTFSSYHLLFFQLNFTSQQQHITNTPAILFLPAYWPFAIAGFIYNPKLEFLCN